MHATPGPYAGAAAFRGIRATGVVEHADLLRKADKVAAGGFWVVVATFEGRLDAWRMAHVSAAPPTPEPHTGSWQGPAADAWVTSLDRDDYRAGVEAIRGHIREGDVYQVNLCRVLSAPLPGRKDGYGPNARALSGVLARGNPARYAARIEIPPDGPVPGAWVVSASPELYLAVEGTEVTSSPIKGTSAPGEPMLPKDGSENVMITDLVRNDLSHAAVPGSVRVPELLARHAHPGLDHLQSTVAATLAPEFAWTARMWPALLEGTFPPGSVSGAPKASALEIISAQEPVARGPYCGGIGWIDADARRAELAVGIRTFWWDERDGGTLRFGTGAGITWDSDPDGEWRETELKASRLIALASGATMLP